jgi:chemotaxis protein CheD
VPAPSLSNLGFEHRVVVGLAEMAVSNNPGAVMTTYSLGSCVGVAIYDPVAKVGGLLHAMLPDSRLDPAKAARQPAMFVDTGMFALLQEAMQLRADKRRLRIYVAGGAQIMDDGNVFNIGGRNRAALDAFLSKENLRADAQQVGGCVNRTMYFAIQTGRVTLKVSGLQNEVILC